MDNFIKIRLLKLGFKFCVFLIELKKATNLFVGGLLLNQGRVHICDCRRRRDSLTGCGQLRLRSDFRQRFAMSRRILVVDGLLHSDFLSEKFDVSKRREKTVQRLRKIVSCSDNTLRWLACQIYKL